MTTQCGMVTAVEKVRRPKDMDWVARVKIELQAGSMELIMHPDLAKDRYSVGTELTINVRHKDAEGV